MFLQAAGGLQLVHALQGGAGGRRRSRGNADDLGGVNIRAAALSGPAHPGNLLLQLAGIPDADYRRGRRSGAEADSWLGIFGPPAS